MIHSIVSDTKSRVDNGFPKLMISDDINSTNPYHAIVLFNTVPSGAYSYEGIVVGITKVTSRLSIGQVSRALDISEFMDFTGSVELSNS